MLNLLVSLIFYTGVLLNSYKVFLMPYQPYNIFPWSPEINPAKSSSTFLISHTLIALLTSYVNYNWYFQQQRIKRNDTTVNNRVAIHQENVSSKTALFCHFFFALGVLFNISHLGNLSPDKAFMVNTAALLGLSLSVLLKKPLMYFLLLNFPVYLEVVKLVSYIITSM